MKRRGLLLGAAAAGALVLSTGSSRAAGGWTGAPAPGLVGPVAAFSDTDAWSQGSAGGFAHWNGSAWTPVPAGAGEVIASGLADDGPTDAWAVGWGFTGYIWATPQISHWNGSAWSVVPSPVFSGTLAGLTGVVSLGPANAWAVGYDGHKGLAEHWNGSSWSRVAVPDPNAGNSLYSNLHNIVASPSGDLWAIGEYGTSATTDSLYSLHYDGASWHLIPLARPSDQGAVVSAWSIAAITADDVWAAGEQGTNARTNTLIEHWNGAAWSIVPSPFDHAGTSGTQTFADLGSLTARSSNDVWASGTYNTYDFTTGTSGQDHALLIHWGGSAWTQDTSLPTETTAYGSIGGLGTTLGGHVIWAVNAGNPNLLEHP